MSGCVASEADEADVFAPAQELPVESQSKPEEAQEIPEAPPEDNIVEDAENEDDSEDEAPYVPPLRPSDIGMTEEIYALAMQRANELAGLFLDFLQFNEYELVFSFDVDNTIGGNRISVNGYEYIDRFFVVNHETLKTYNDLYMQFNKTCVPELSTRLLKQTSHYYTDINGQLHFSDTMLARGPMMSIEGGKLVSFNILNENEILLYFTVDMFYAGDAAYEGRTIEYSITLKDINDEWLIADCLTLNAITHHGYEWILS
jgi:hypothetical protein